jgi:hypothetical protein
VAGLRGLEVKHGKMVEDYSPVGNVVQDRIRDIAMLDPESPGKRADFMRQELVGRFFPNESMQHRPSCSDVSGIGGTLMLAKGIASPPLVTGVARWCGML